MFQPTTDEPAPAGVVVSDLHLFTRRSRALRHVPALHGAARRAAVTVLAGDIVDFRWSELESLDATLDAAERWLGELLDAAVDGELHYVLGNHDHEAAWIVRLEALARAEPRFHWHPFQLRIGDSVFLHGDAAQPGMTSGGLARYRERFARPRRPSRATARAYDVAMAFRAHAVGARAMFPPSAVVRRLGAYLDDIGLEIGRDVHDVYFGHTHLALDALEHRGARFHNGGAPLAGLEFRIVEAHLS